jgi:hypothetical protein
LRQDVRVRRCNGQHLLGHVFGQAVGMVRSVGDQHLGDAGDLGRFGRYCGAVAAGDQDVNITAAGDCRGNGVVGASLQGCVVVFCND